MEEAPKEIVYPTNFSFYRATMKLYSPTEISIMVNGEQKSASSLEEALEIIQYEHKRCNIPVQRIAYYMNPAEAEPPSSKIMSLLRSSITVPKSPCYIVVANGKSFFISPKHIEIIRKYTTTPSQGYVTIRTPEGRMQLHRYLFGPGKYHKDMNGMNNTIENMVEK